MMISQSLWVALREKYRELRMRELRVQDGGLHVRCAEWEPVVGVPYVCLVADEGLTSLVVLESDLQWPMSINRVIEEYLIEHFDYSDKASRSKAIRALEVISANLNERAQ